MMKIAVFGLGYVGSVTLAALASQGHQITGIDPNQVKVDIVNSGKSPVVETGLGDLIQQGVAAGRIRAITKPEGGFDAFDVSIICVGTPSRANGSLDLQQAVKVCEEIGSQLAGLETRHTVVVRSTMVPGSTERELIPAIERTSGRVVGTDLGVCYNPEFLREGTSLRDYFDPPFTLIGASDERTAEVLTELYRAVDAEVLSTPIAIAEMLKYASNSYHALKVTFANEIGAICDELGVDGRAVMEIFTRDTKLNISSAYLRPGFAFGGSCLPKDLRALVHRARSLDVDVPVLESISASNAVHVERALQSVIATGKRRIGILGLSFKHGTDDLRESPAVELSERLIGKGFELAIYDRSVFIASLYGSNRDFITKEIAHIATLMRDSIADVIDDSDVLVIANGAEEFRVVPDLIRPEQHLIDLVGLLDR